MEIISRKEALSRGLLKYFTGKPCKHGHITERWLKGVCLGCQKDKYRKNPEPFKRRALTNYHNNPKSARDRACRWQKENPGKVRARTIRQRILKEKRTPKWADFKEIEKIYQEAKLISEMTGVQYHVDHIIPLCGELVSGLHVHYNLQLLPASVNLSKSNKFPLV